MAVRQPRQPRSVRRVLEVLPIELLRDVKTGGRPLQCSIKVGKCNPIQCQLGGAQKAHSKGSNPDLWPGSVLIDIPNEPDTLPEDNFVTLGVSFDGENGGTVDIGSTSFSVGDLGTKDTHRRWLEAPVLDKSPVQSKRSARNLLQLKARLHESLVVNVDQQDEPVIEVPKPERQPRQPRSNHPRLPVAPRGLLRRFPESLSKGFSK